MPITNSPKGSAIPVRPTPQMRQQLDELIAAGWGNQTDVIRTAIDRMHKETNMKDVWMWQGKGWYAPRQEGGAVWYYWCGGDEKTEPNTYSMGLGTPTWRNVPPAENSRTEVKRIPTTA